MERVFKTVIGFVAAAAVISACASDPARQSDTSQSSPASTAAAGEELPAESPEAESDPFADLRRLIDDNARYSDFEFTVTTIVRESDATNEERIVVSAVAQSDGSDAYTFHPRSRCHHVRGVLSPVEDSDDVFRWSPGEPPETSLDYSLEECELEATDFLDIFSGPLDITIADIDASGATLTIDGVTERWVIQQR